MFIFLVVVALEGTSSPSMVRKMNDFDLSSGFLKMKLLFMAAALLSLLSACAVHGDRAPASSSKVEVFGDLDAGVSVRR